MLGRVGHPLDLHAYQSERASSLTGSDVAKLPEFLLDQGHFVHDYQTVHAYF